MTTPTYEPNTTSARWLIDLAVGLQFLGEPDHLTDAEVRRALDYRREGIAPSVALTDLLAERVPAETTPGHADR